MELMELMELLELMALIDHLARRERTNPNRPENRRTLEELADMLAETAKRSTDTLSSFWPCSRLAARIGRQLERKKWEQLGFCQVLTEVLTGANFPQKTAL